MIHRSEQRRAPPVRLRTFPFSVLLTVGLLGCAQRGGPPPGPPADAPRALVYGQVSSPILDTLRVRATVMSGNGSEQPGDYDLMVIDGDAFPGQQLRAELSVRKAIRAGKWLLGLDLDEDDKTGLAAVFNGSTPSRSHAFLARQTRSPNGHQVNTFLDFARYPSSAEQVARQVIRNVTAGAADNDTPDPPAQAFAVIYRDLDPNSEITMLGNNNPFFTPPYLDPPPQTATWQANHYVTVMMDADKNHPQGAYQHVVVKTQGRANPNRLMFNNRDRVGDSGSSELAWIQTQFGSAHAFVPTPDSPSDQVLELQETSPQNSNESTKITTGIKFEVEASREGVDANFTYEDTVEHDIPDWGLTNFSGGNRAEWKYYSRLRYDGLSSGWDDSAWFYYFIAAAPAEPTSLSLNDNEYTYLSHWTNSAVSANQVTFGGLEVARYSDVWGVDKRDYVPPPAAVEKPFCNGFNECRLRLYILRNDVPKPWSIKVDMSAVVPVGIASLTFDDNPVTANQPTMATLKLAGPTPIDAVISIRSDKSGVAPPNDEYTIHAGEDSVRIPINVGPQGCEAQSATITAWYANPLNAVLSIKPPPDCH